MDSWWVQSVLFWASWVLVTALLGVVWPNARDEYLGGRIGRALGLTWGTGILGFILTAFLFFVAAAVFGFRILG